MFRQKATSAFSWFSCGSHILVEMQFGDLNRGTRRTQRKTLGERRIPTEISNLFCLDAMQIRHR